jgi:hypothetical protein
MPVSDHRITGSRKTHKKKRWADGRIGPLAQRFCFAGLVLSGNIEPQL